MSASPEEQAVIDAAQDNVMACSALHEASARVRGSHGCDEETVSVLIAEEADAIAQAHRTHGLMKKAVHALLQKRAKDASAQLRSEVDALSKAVTEAKEAMK